MIDHATTNDDERLMKDAIDGRMTKHELATHLAVGPKHRFLDACAAIEQCYTDDCAAAKDPCLESGCAAEGEVCLQPLLRAGTDYQKACGTEWVKLFADCANRA